MSVSNVSFSTQLVSLAMEMKSEQVGQQISVAVLKQTLEQQNRQGQALVEMIQRSSTLDGVGRIVNISI